MCVAIPMRVQSIDGETARVELAGTSRDISIVLVPGVRPGDYVIVHAGFAIETVDDGIARQTIAYFRSMAGNGEDQV